MMLEIELINNRSGRLIGSREIIAELSEYLAEEDPRAKFVTAYKRGFWDGVVRFIGARDIFPIGLLPRIYNYCHNHLNITPKIYDNRGFIHKTCTIPHILGDKKLRDYQYKAAYLALNRSVGKTPFPRGIIAAATNAGKSLISAAIAKALLDNKVDILFLCHRAEIFDQIFEWYGEYLETDVGRYNTKFNDIRNVTVGMITTLYARRKSSDVRAMLEHFKCLIVDEAHHASSKSWSSIIYSSNAFYKFGLSGTAFQSEPHKNTTIRGLFGPGLAKITNKQLVDKSYSAKPNIAFVSYEPESLLDDPKIRELTDIERAMVKKQKSAEKHGNSMLLDKELRNVRRELYTLVYMKGVCNSINRAESIVDIVSDHEDDQILIVVNKIAHGNFIRKVLNGYGISAIFVNGKTPDEDRSEIRKMFTNGDIRVLIATLIYKEGVDIPAIDILIIAVGEKAPHTILQTFGRSLRIRKDKDRVNIYDFDDKGHRVLVKHTNERINIYKSEGFEPKFIEM